MQLGCVLFFFFFPLGGLKETLYAETIHLGLPTSQETTSRLLDYSVANQINRLLAGLQRFARLDFGIRRKLPQNLGVASPMLPHSFQPSFLFLTCHFPGFWVVFKKDSDPWKE